MDEQLNLDLYQDVCIELLKAYDQRPKRVHAFLLCGKEPYNTFLQVCRSVDTIKATDFDFAVEFSTPGKEKDFQMLGVWCMSNVIVSKALFKHVKNLELKIKSIDRCYRWFLPHFNGLESVENVELVFEDSFGCTLDIVRSIMRRIGPVKTMTADLTVFELASFCVKDYKMDKMTVKLQGEQSIGMLSELSNLLPVNLQIESAFQKANRGSEMCQFFKDFVLDEENRNFLCVKTFRFVAYFHSVSFEVATMSFIPIFKLIEKCFPNAEEIIFNRKSYDLDNINLCMGKSLWPKPHMIEGHLRHIYDDLTAYKGNAKICMTYELQFEIDFLDPEIGDFMDELRKLLCGYDYSVDGIDFIWRKKFNPAPNVTYEVDFSVRKNEPREYVSNHNVPKLDNYDEIEYYFRHGI